MYVHDEFNVYLDRDIEILRSISHENILKIFDFHEGKKFKVEISVQKYFFTLNCK